MTAELKELEERSLEPTPNSPPWSSIYSSNSERNWPPNSTTPRYQSAARRPDVLAALAETAALHRYVRPPLTPVTASISSKAVTPVVERLDLQAGLFPMIPI